MVVRLDAFDRRMPSWLNSCTIRVAVFRSQSHSRARSTFEATNCPGCRTAEKFFPETIVSSRTAIRMKVLRHFIRRMSCCSSVRYSSCASLKVMLYLTFVYCIRQTIAAGTAWPIRVPCRHRRRSGDRFGRRWLA